MKRLSVAAIVSLFLALAPVLAYAQSLGAPGFTSPVVSISSGQLTCSYTPVTTGTQSVAYTGATPSSSGGTPSYTYSETGSLPSGLTISSSTGIISGTPSGSGSFAGIQVIVTDSLSNTAHCGSSFTLVISAAATPMITPLFFAGAASVPSNSATNFAPLVGSDAGFIGFSTSATGKDNPIAIASTLSTLVVNPGTPLTQGSWVITIYKNGSPTSLTCTVASTGSTCPDTTDTVTVAPNDLLGYQTVPTGTPTAQTSFQMSVLLSSTNTGEGILYSTGSTTTNPSTTVQNYIGLQGAGSYSATEAQVSTLMPTAGVVDTLFADDTVGPGAAKTYIVTLMQNGTATGLTCTLTGAGVQSCPPDFTHTVTVAANDTLSIRMDPNGTTPTNTGGVRVGMRWKPTTAGESVVSTWALTVPGTTGSAAFDLTASPSYLHSETVVPSIAPSVFKIDKLFVSQDVAPGGATTRSVQLRKGTGSGQTSQLLTCPIPSAGTTCSDITHSYTTTLNDLLNWQTTATGTNAALTWFKASAVVCTGGSC